MGGGSKQLKIPPGGGFGRRCKISYRAYICWGARTYAHKTIAHKTIAHKTIAHKTILLPTPLAIFATIAHKLFF